MIASGGSPESITHGFGRRRITGRAPAGPAARWAEVIWLPALIAVLVLARAPVLPRGARRGGGERGDVPGWVLITLMTAGLVTMLWAVAGEQLRELFTTALAAVTGPTR